MNLPSTSDPNNCVSLEQAGSQHSHQYCRLTTPFTIAVRRMDSQITLVNPSPAFTLVFSKDSVTNATIYANSMPRYTIVTADAYSILRTDIIDAQTRGVLVTITRRPVLSDTITFANRNGGEPMKINKFLKGHKLTGGCLLSTEEGAFIWKSDENHRLALYPEDDLDVPIAYAKLSTPSSLLTLQFEAGTRDFTDLILGSFLVLEHKLRTGEGDSRNSTGTLLDRRTWGKDYTSERGRQLMSLNGILL